MHVEILIEAEAATAGLDLDLRLAPRDVRHRVDNCPGEQGPPAKVGMSTGVASGPKQVALEQLKVEETDPPNARCSEGLTAGKA